MSSINDHKSDSNSSSDLNHDDSNINDYEDFSLDLVNSSPDCLVFDRLKKVEFEQRLGEYEQNQAGLSQGQLEFSQLDSDQNLSDFFLLDLYSSDTTPIASLTPGELPLPVSPPGSARRSDHLKIYHPNTHPHLPSCYPPRRLCFTAPQKQEVRLQALSQLEESRAQLDPAVLNLMTSAGGRVSATETSGIQLFDVEDVDARIAGQLGFELDGGIGEEKEVVEPFTGVKLYDMDDRVLTVKPTTSRPAGIKLYDMDSSLLTGYDATTETKQAVKPISGIQLFDVEDIDACITGQLGYNTPPNKETLQPTISLPSKIQLLNLALSNNIPTKTQFDSLNLTSTHTHTHIPPSKKKQQKSTSSLNSSMDLLYERYREFKVLLIFLLLLGLSFVYFVHFQDVEYALGVGGWGGCETVSEEFYSWTSGSNSALASEGEVLMGEGKGEGREKNEGEICKTATELLTLKESINTRQLRIRALRRNFTMKLWDLVREVWAVEEWVGRKEGGEDRLSGFKVQVHYLMQKEKWADVLGVLRDEMGVLGQKEVGEGEGDEDIVLRDARMRIKNAIGEVGRVLVEMNEEIVELEEEWKVWDDGVRGLEVDRCWREGGSE